TEATPWPHHNRPRNAAVSAFGVSGTNAHLILSEAPARKTAADTPHEAGTPGEAGLPLTLSAKSRASLRAQATRLHSHLTEHPDLPLPHVAHALATTRSVFNHRAVLTTDSREEALLALDALGADRPHPALVQGMAGDAGAESGGTAFVFPGQGSQYPGMARQLLVSSPAFRKTVLACEEALSRYVDWSLTDVLEERAGAPGLDRVDVVQPALFAVLVALARHWQAAGIEPDAVLGHSQGEIAAAHIAGALSLEDAVHIVALRSRALTSLEGSGGMASLPLGAEAAAELLVAWQGRLTISAVNGPGATVVAGDTSALEELLAQCATDGIDARKIAVSYASHSHHIDALTDELLEALAPIRARPASIPFHSTVTGTLLDTRELTASYWCRNLRHTVQLEATVRGLLDTGCRTFIEVSPHPVLTPALQSTVDTHPGAEDDTATPPLVTGTLHRNRPAGQAFHTALGQLHTHHHTINWPTTRSRNRPCRQAADIHSTPPHRPLHLPTYPFQHDSYWIAPQPRTHGHADENGPALLPLHWEPFPTSSTTAALPSHTALLTDPLNAHLDSAPAPGTTTATTAIAALIPATHHRRDLAELGHALENGAAAPDTVIAPLPTSTTPTKDTPTEIHDTLTRTLTFLQHWLNNDHYTNTHLILTTHHATTVHPDEDPNLTHATLTGLIRTAQTEHPHRITLIDLDTHPDTPRALPHTLTTNEPHLAIRQGTLHIPRLTRLPHTPTPDTPATTWNPQGTVLITGGTGTLAAHTARHLVTHHGIRHLHLASRTGQQAPGADQLTTQLTQLGAKVTITACDTADPDQITALLDTIPATHPLSAIIHTAGTIDMAPIQNLTPQQLHTVLRPKIDTAWNLHHATRHLNLDAFILYSSLAATLASPGQANYAAANTYLNALAHHRHTQNLPATSIAWGPWADNTGMIRHLNTTTRNHTTRTGFPPHTTQHALTLLDTALTTHHPTTTATHLNTTNLTTQAHNNTLPPLLHNLTPTPTTHHPSGSTTDDMASRHSRTGSLAEGLGSLTKSEQLERLLSLVRTTIAAVLASPDPELIDARQSFKELGFDSLTTLQLRNHLAHASGIRLPATLAFDHPTPQSLATYLREQLVPAGGEQASGNGVLDVLMAEIGKLESAFSPEALDVAEHAQVSARLREFVKSWENRQGHSATDSAPGDLDSATDDELFSVLDGELQTP
ncbi:SDR family NAD(P)-dependent oxidoreductase, partial [Streptomyces sp. NPDC056486]|uniref:SDR family NAD(P)-dependent oxidoreductase n=1 Tax=Streptomyces sp. NPDC056486 TaxID=3345835 RepID=UPI0036B7CE32